MDSSTHKLYHVHGFDSRQLLETYLSDKPEMVFGEESLIFPIENLRETFTAGHINGEILIDISIGPMIHHLYAACEFFKHIIVLKPSDRCIMELKRWLDTRTGAFHWGHATQLHVDSNGNSDQLQDKEEKMRSAFQHVMKCDFEKENIIEPLDLPPADCIISAWLLDVISKDHDDYRGYLRKFSRLLKPGGNLILFGVTDATYFIVGKDKLHVLSCDEDFVRKALDEAGFVIDCYKVKETKVRTDLIDFKGVIFIAAHKEKKLKIKASFTRGYLSTDPNAHLVPAPCLRILPALLKKIEGFQPRGCRLLLHSLYIEIAVYTVISIHAQ